MIVDKDHLKKETKLIVENYRIEILQYLLCKYKYAIVEICVMKTKVKSE